LRVFMFLTTEENLTRDVIGEEWIKLGTEKHGWLAGCKFQSKEIFSKGPLTSSFLPNHSDWTSVLSKWHGHFHVEVP
jgi:hypothetical protein